MAQPYEQMLAESRQLATRMRTGTGAASLLHPNNAPTHHIDALERFQKDFAAYDKQRRALELSKRQSELQRRRVELLQRESRRWQREDEYLSRLQQKEVQSVQLQKLGIKRTANSNGLAYNPITLEYHDNAKGFSLKEEDEQQRIRGFVRAHNMDSHGNGRYNPLNGEDRLGVEQLVPYQLNGRYQVKKEQHYDHLAIKLSPTAGSVRSSPFTRYY